MKIKIALSSFLLTVCLSGCGATLTAKDGTKMPVSVSEYRAYRDKPAPTVLISHGSDGVQKHHVEWAKEIQSWGFNAVVIDHYSLRGISMHIGIVLPNMRGEHRARDIVEAGRWAKSQTWHKGKISVIGFSQGGSGVMALVNGKDREYNKILLKGEEMPIDSAVAFYPGCSISFPPLTPSMPVQMHLAGEDTLALTSYCEPLTDKNYTVHRYNNATHAFDVYLGSFKPKFYHRYDPNITAVAKKNTRDFLVKNLKE